MLIMSNNGRYLMVQHQSKVCRCLLMDIWKRKGCTKLTFSVTSKNTCTAHFFYRQSDKKQQHGTEKSVCTYFDNLCSWNTSSPPVRSQPHYRSAPSPLAVTIVLMMIYKHLYTQKFRGELYAVFIMLVRESLRFCLFYMVHSQSWYLLGLSGPAVKEFFSKGPIY